MNVGFDLEPRSPSMSDFDPEYVFSHHSATPEKLAHYEAIHEAAKAFAQVILQRVPDSADRDGVLHLLREASMLACSAISLDGRLK
jgi:hypothetical protein